VRLSGRNGLGAAFFNSSAWRAFATSSSCARSTLVFRATFRRTVFFARFLAAGRLVGFFALLFATSRFAGFFATVFFFDARRFAFLDVAAFFAVRFAAFFAVRFAAFFLDVFLVALAIAASSKMLWP
jgi:hypothetical protein